LDDRSIVAWAKVADSSLGARGNVQFKLDPNLIKIEANSVIPLHSAYMKDRPAEIWFGYVTVIFFTAGAVLIVWALW
jgi:hypothetical protein